MRLCTFEEYCPSGEFGETMKGFGLDWYKDSWSPFYDPNSLNQRSDNVNNWLQVFSILNSSIGCDSTVADRNKIVCCRPEPPF